MDILEQNPVYRDIRDFNHWHLVFDYESDETQVDLLDANGYIIESFYYPKFTSAEFDYFKNKK